MSAEVVPGRAIGLDLGSHRIGVAISDDRRAVATPLEVVDARNRVEADRRIGEIIDEWEPTVVVVGLPLHLNGAEGRAVRQTKKGLDRLRATFSVPFVTYDERLTTVTAHRSLDEQNIRNHDRRDMVDMIAAQVILQGWMDRERT